MSKERSACLKCDKIFPVAHFEWRLWQGTLYPCRDWCIQCRLKWSDQSEYPRFMTVHQANLERQLKAAQTVDAQSEQIKALKAQVEALKAQIEALKAQGADSTSASNSSTQATSTSLVQGNEEPQAFIATDNGTEPTDIGDFEYVDLSHGH